MANPVRVRTSAGWQDLALVGEPGEKWFSSAGAPAGATGVVGDWHLNSSTGDVSEKTGVSTWTVRGNIKGPQGDTGAQGPQGVQGDTGSQGATGPPGIVYDSDQIGTIKAFTGTAVPTNWRLCNGDPVTAAAYPELAAAWGVSGTFNLPDLRGKFLYGATAVGLGATGGGFATVALQTPHMPSHRHTVSSHDHGTYSGLTGYFDANHDHAFGGSGSTSGGAGTHSHPAAAGSTFVVGGTTTGAVGTTKVVGGGANLTTGDAGGHDHSVSVGGTTNQTTQNHRHALVAQSPGTDWKGGTGSPQSDGAGAEHENLPPYILVAFIIKVTGPMIDSGGALVGPQGPQGIQGVKGDTGNQGIQGPQGPAGVGTFRVGHTFSVAGALAAGALPGFFVPVVAGQTVAVVGARAKLASGTSVVVQVTRNGSNLGSAATVTPTASAPTLSQALANNDELGITLSSPTGSPVGLSFTIYLEHVA